MANQLENENEVWRPVMVSPFENYYEVSSLGRVRSLHFCFPKLLKPTFRAKYLGVHLSGRGISNTQDVHRLVALAFIPNHENKPCINHINGKKDDNRAENLEWATVSENTKHALDSGLLKTAKMRVSQFDMEGNFIKTYNSVSEASVETGCQATKICAVCKGKAHYTNGFKWKYTDFEWNPKEEPEGKVYPDFPNYVITKDGKVYSKCRKIFLKTCINANYECIMIRKKGETKTCSVHTLVAELHVPNPNNYRYVNHINGIQHDNRAENLIWSDSIAYKNK